MCPSSRIGRAGASAPTGPNLDADFACDATGPGGVRTVERRTAIPNDTSVLVELIGSHDLWIAATALAHGMRLATVNARRFARVPGLDVLAVQ